MSMYNMLVEAHSGWRHIVILILAIAILRALYGWIRGSSWVTWDQRLGMATPIVMDIQFLMGLILWIMSQQWLGFNSLTAWEHPVTMLLAIATAHITWTQVKKKTDPRAKFQTETIGFAIAGVILTLGVLRITHVL